MEVQQIAKEVADDLTILYGAEIYYTSDILENWIKKLFQLWVERVML